MDTILFYLHHALTLLWGIVLSVSFCGIKFTKRNTIFTVLIFVLCGISELATLMLSGGIEWTVWKLYPLIVHLPLIVMLCLLFQKKTITVIAAVSLAYLCCQPSKWFGLFIASFTDNSAIVWVSKIIIAAAVVIIVLHFFSYYISNIFNKDARSILTFSCAPMFYYVFDYIVGIYTNLWVEYALVVSEFLAFSLYIFFMLFCVVYYREYEKKLEAEHKEQIIRITAQQQAKEVKTIKESTLETSLLRHDMRLMLSNLSLCIEQNDTQQALKIISGFAKQVEATSLHRYCKNDTINYILMNFENQCKEASVDFQASVQLDTLHVDEILFSSIISNALDNALNAQTELPVSARQIKLMLKDADGKLLLSVKNPVKTAPVFVDGLPSTNKAGHGYGTQSIRYMTEKLGGKYQFTSEEDLFILRIVI